MYRTLPPVRLLVLLLLCTLTGLAGRSVQAQTVDGQLSSTISGGTLAVQVALKVTPQADFGSATFRFTYNDAALAIPSGAAVNTRLTSGTDYNFLPVTNTHHGSTEYFNAANTFTVPGVGTFSTTNYQHSTITRPRANEISVNIVLSSQGNGIPLSQVAGTYTPIVTIYFDILDPAQSASLIWRTSGANATVAYHEDNLTPLTLGTFIDDTPALPVELTAFEAVADGEAVVLAWTTAGETNNAGFEVEVRGGASLQEAAWQRVAFVEGRGTTQEAQAYRYRAEGLAAGTYRFRLKQVDFDGTFTYSPEVEVALELAEAFRMTAPYPNPTTGRAAMELQVRTSQQVEVSVYDMLGRRVEVVYAGRMEAGRPEHIELEGSAWPSGMYVVRVAGERFTHTMPLVQVR